VLMVLIWWGYQLMAMHIDFGQPGRPSHRRAVLRAACEEAITPDQLASMWVSLRNAKRKEVMSQ